jgi:hypothetical protein
MKRIPTFDDFINESQQLNEAMESDIKILTDLGFTQEVKYKGGDGPMHFGSPLRPSVKHENFYHPKVTGYSLSFIDHSWKYGGFAVWDDTKNEMYYIWKQKTSNSNMESNMKKALTRVATDISNGKLPKPNPIQIEKHYNS